MRQFTHLTIYADNRIKISHRNRLRKRVKTEVPPKFKLIINLEVSNTVRVKNIDYVAWSSQICTIWLIFRNRITQINALYFVLFKNMLY